MIGIYLTYLETLLASKLNLNLRSEKGVPATEYIIIALFIVIVAALIFGKLGGKIEGVGKDVLDSF